MLLNINQTVNNSTKFYNETCSSTESTEISLNSIQYSPNRNIGNVWKINYNGFRIFFVMLLNCEHLNTNSNNMENLEMATCVWFLRKKYGNQIIRSTTGILLRVLESKISCRQFHLGFMLNCFGLIDVSHYFELILFQ